VFGPRSKLKTSLRWISNRTSFFLPFLYKLPPPSFFLSTNRSNYNIISSTPSKAKTKNHKHGPQNGLLLCPAPVPVARLHRCKYPKICRWCFHRHSIHSWVVRWESAWMRMKAETGSFIQARKTQRSSR
jgi:hypothetical protein